MRANKGICLRCMRSFDGDNFFADTVHLPIHFNYEMSGGTAVNEEWTMSWYKIFKKKQKYGASNVLSNQFSLSIETGI